jgi:hypothetical protein
MKRTTIELAEAQAAMLHVLALKDRRTLADLVYEALAEYLVRRGMDPAERVIEPRREIPDEEWRSSFQAVVERIRARVPKDWSPEEIEAEITAAWEEVRQERAERRQASSA